MRTRQHTSVLQLAALLAAGSGIVLGQTAVTGNIADPQGRAVIGARVKITRTNGSPIAEVQTDSFGQFLFRGIQAGEYQFTASAAGFVPVTKVVLLPQAEGGTDLRFEKLAAQSESIVISAKTIEPAIDMRNAEVFNRTLFTRDDQVFQQLNAGINAGQHEGGGKSLEIRRFGFNLDHGGVNGGLKVLVDDVQQNQGSQGHGQGYLGSLKALSPELIQEVTIINGPFSAEYGDFSGLGVVHIRQRESLAGPVHGAAGRRKLRYRARLSRFQSGCAENGFLPCLRRLLQRWAVHQSRPVSP